jgi:hypothetical protein
MRKLLVLLLLLFTIPFITACEEQPHEECVETWDYKMVERQILFVSYTAYVLETEYGDITVSKGIYESAMAEEYSKVCMMVNPQAENEFLGGTLIDGTPIDQDLVDEVADQVIPDEFKDDEEE